MPQRDSTLYYLVKRAGAGSVLMGTEGTIHAIDRSGRPRIHRRPPASHQRAWQSRQDFDVTSDGRIIALQTFDDTRPP